MPYDVTLTTSPLFTSGPEVGAAPPSGFMSPEELMLFVEHQVNSIDDQIRARMGDIEARKKYAAKFQEVANKIKEMKHHNGEQQDQDITQLKAELDALEQTDPMYKELSDKVDGIHDQLIYELKDNEGGSDEWLEEKANSISGMSNDITNTIELDMIRLQGLVQQRTQCMTFASNVLAAMNEANKQIIGNTRG